MTCKKESTKLPIEAKKKIERKIRCIKELYGMHNNQLITLNNVMEAAKRIGGFVKFQPNIVNEFDLYKIGQSFLIEIAPMDIPVDQNYYNEFESNKTLQENNKKYIVAKAIATLYLNMNYDHFGWQGLDSGLYKKGKEDECSEEKVEYFARAFLLPRKTFIDTVVKNVCKNGAIDYDTLVEKMHMNKNIIEKRLEDFDINTKKLK